MNHATSRRFPRKLGLFGQPTVINNVETLINVPSIVLDGGDAFASVGSGQSTGTKLFCLSGHVMYPGYTRPISASLFASCSISLEAYRAPDGCKAVLIGGAAGAFVGPRDLEMPLTFEGARAAGTSLGSAVVMPFDDTVDLQQILLRIAAFFRDESCGQCVPCRVGTVRQEELLHRLAQKRPIDSRATELVVLKEVGQAMRDASICGLGQTASSAIESAFARFNLFRRRHEFKRPGPDRSPYPADRYLSFHLRVQAVIVKSRLTVSLSPFPKIRRFFKRRALWASILRPSAIWRLLRQ